MHLYGNACWWQVFAYFGFLVYIDETLTRNEILNASKGEKLA